MIFKKHYKSDDRAFLTEKCKFVNGVKIGSMKCQTCEHRICSNSIENWVQCELYDKEKHNDPRYKTYALFQECAEKLQNTTQEEFDARCKQVQLDEKHVGLRYTDNSGFVLILPGVGLIDPDPVETCKLEDVVCVKCGHCQSVDDDCSTCEHENTMGNECDGCGEEVDDNGKVLTAVSHYKRKVIV